MAVPGDVACDHYHRYREDVALMRRLGAQVYRFSVAWPRVLPQGRGQANSLGLDFYDRLIDELLGNGIEPWLCLYHWDLPQALDDLGGWQNRDIALWFADYAALVARRYGDRVRHFATFNEPNVCTLFGYGMGWNAPGIANRRSFLQAAHHVNLAHGEAVRTLRALAPGALLGAIYNRQACLPISAAPQDAVAAGILDACWNRLYADPQCLAEYPPELAEGLQEFVAPGRHGTHRPADRLVGPEPLLPDLCARRSGPAWFCLGRCADRWPPDRRGLAHRPGSLPQRSDRHAPALQASDLHYGEWLRSPRILDEAGGVNDGGRIAYLARYTKALEEAVASGADVRGYFLWSLLDNLEWGAGFASRFEIVYVDYATQRRVPKASFDWFAQLIRAQQHGDHA